MHERCLVAMSGGVDSAVAALLLKRSSRDVAGVTLRLYDGPSDGGRCCNHDAQERAAAFAAAFGIPHYVLDARDEFRRLVIADFASEYAQGRTPNPCVRCNRFIKFSWLLERAKALGFDALATGHYVLREYDAARRSFILRRAKSALKDQSYFLWDTPAGALPSLRFPVGGLTKDEVRALLAEVVPGKASQAESQDICFVGGEGYGAFLRDFLGAAADKAGPILDESGATLGVHKGLSRYTVGQRRGLGVSGTRRMYVKKIDAAANAIILADDGSLAARTCDLKRVNWLRDAESRTLTATVTVRYRDAGVTAVITPMGGDRARVTFEKPRRAIAPGQSAAFYDGDVLLGGGVIDDVWD